MSKFKRFSILSLITVLFLTLSGCFYTSGFNGGYHQRSSHYKSYNAPSDRDYHRYDNHRNYDKNYDKKHYRR